MFEKILEISRHFLKIKNSSYRRYFIKNIDLKHRMSILTGQRGVGKTTTLIQHLLDKVEGDRFDKKILYVQADHFALGKTPLYEIAEEFSLLGGKWLAFDEIHKYPDWSKELKSIYDTFPDLTLLISGSSALEIYKGSHDLIRRAASYSMQGLSFREYLELSLQTRLPAYSLDELCKHHEKIAESILHELQSINQKVLPLFYDYLKVGYYPYFFELNDPKIYQMTLEQNLHQTIESDLTAIYPHLTGTSVKKMKQLLTFIANAVPFTPNWKKILNLLEIGDIRTLKNYFKHLEDASLVSSLSKATKKMHQLELPDKLYLNNPNQLYAISSDTPQVGTLREIFFLNSLFFQPKIGLPKEGDFIVNEQYLFEVGGKNKSFNQIKDDSNGYLACDSLEFGIGNKIPLWLFGFLY